MSNTLRIIFSSPPLRPISSILPIFPPQSSTSLHCLLSCPPNHFLSYFPTFEHRSPLGYSAQASSFLQCSNWLLSYYLLTQVSSLTNICAPSSLLLVQHPKHNLSCPLSSPLTCHLLPSSIHFPSRFRFCSCTLPSYALFHHCSSCWDEGMWCRYRFIREVVLTNSYLERNLLSHLLLLVYLPVFYTCPVQFFSFLFPVYSFTNTLSPLLSSGQPTNSSLFSCQHSPSTTSHSSLILLCLVFFSHFSLTLRRPFG